MCSPSTARPSASSPAQRLFPRARRAKAARPPRREPPAAAVDEPAGQHCDDVAQAPVLPGQVHQAAQPGPEGPGAQRLSGGRVEGQVVLGEHLPGHAQVGRCLPECDGEVGGAEGRLIGQALLDLARHGAQLGFPVGGGACHHGWGRGAIPFELRDLRLREPAAQAIAVVRRTLASTRGPASRRHRPSRRGLRGGPSPSPERDGSRRAGSRRAGPHPP